MKYYLAKIDIHDDNSGKVIKEQVLVEADSVHEAEKRFNEHMEGTISTFEIVSINKTPIASVIKHKDKPTLV